MKRTNRILTLLIVFVLMSISSTVYAKQPGLSSFPKPVDTQSWVLPRDMIWKDYKPIPGIDWQKSTIEPERVLRGALIIVDFPDQEFIISQSKGSEIAGNP
ncbi:MULTISPECIES: hypothetical protein [Bacillus]|uniref:hypothetical protein n=1 Tax=Bacillus TaxID=1386 RepID=UPI001E615E4D|nr:MULTISPECIES: hypothetical protein [Bacillus]